MSALPDHELGISDPFLNHNRKRIPPLSSSDIIDTPPAYETTNAPRYCGLLGQKQGLRRFLGPKRVALLILSLLTISFAWHLHSRGLLEPTVLVQLLEEYPLSSTAIFAVLYAVSVIGALPTLPLNLAAGLFWGPLWGGLIASLGASLGAVCAFFAARILLGQPLARRFDNSLVAWMQQELNAKGWRFIAFLRLNPVFPTGPLNYILGLTSINAVTYAWATMVFLLPPSLAVAWIGYEMGTFVIDGEVADFIKTIIGISAAVTILFAIRYVAKYFNQTRTASL